MDGERGSASRRTGTTSAAGGSTGVLGRGAGWLADREALPTSVRAVLGYYAVSGEFDYDALRLKSRVDDVLADILDDAYAPVEREIAAAFDRDAVEFSYDTKLTMPAELTLGYCYRQAMRDSPAGVDPLSDGDIPEAYREPVERAEAMTRLVVEALLDGDMRDAINDAEYEDFEVDFPVDDEGRAEVARIARDTLQESVERQFERFPDEVREAYDWAVEHSEAHQDTDEHFRDIMERAADGDADAVAAIDSEYKYAEFDDPPKAFDRTELDLPYFKTQYRRVGVIYDGMLDMYRAADFAIDEAFESAIVLAIIGAQVWLDDVGDFEADMLEGQLTPVTAEYLLADDDHEAYRTVVDVTERYLDLAKAYASESDTPLTGIAVEYIDRSGEPSLLPGSGGR